MTSEQVQKYARIVLYWIAGALLAHGVGNQSLVEPFVSIGVTIVTALWTIYGDRIVAKIAELEKLGYVAVPTNQEAHHG